MQWTVGKVRITQITESRMTGSTRFILPQAGPDEVKALPGLIPDFANEEGRLKMSIHALVVETPTRRIVVDTCLGNDKEGRGVPTWNHLNTPFLRHLAEAGYAPETIDTVLCTHLHVDHVGWNTKLENGRWVPTFTKARYVFGRDEYDYWKDHSERPDHAAVFADSIKPVIDAGLVDFTASNADIADEITLIPTPGHSPGHMSVHIRSDGAEALLTGDAAHHPVQMAHPDWASTADADTALSTRSRIDLFTRFANTDTLVIGGHYGAGHIRRDGDVWRFDALQN